MATKKTRHCIFCGKDKSESGFFATSNETPLEDNMGVCKICAEKMVNPMDIFTVHFMLKILNKPFINTAWETALSTKPHKPFGKYLSLICGSQYKDYVVYDDGEKLSDETVENINEEELTDKEINLMSKYENNWGKGFSLDDYLFLEDQYNMWTTRNKCDEYAEEVLYREICLKQLEIRKIRSEGKGGDVDKKVKALQELMGSANIKPSDTNAISSTENINSLGLWIKDIEKFRPAEYFKDKKLYVDFDGFKEYIERFILRPLKNLLTGSREFDSEFNIEDDKGDSNE